MARTARQTALQGGFSLMELMIVVAIVAILAAVAMPAYFNHMMRSRQTAVISELMSIKAAQERFFAERGGYAGRMNALLNPDEPDPGKFQYMYAATATYTNGDYRYWVTPDTNSLIRTGTIMAEGDLNHDGNFTDAWEISIDNLDAKPDNTASNEGFTWSSLGNLFK